jgi:hypothetical protein
MISTEESKCRCQAATGRLSIDAHSRRVDTKFFGVLAQPVQRGEAVVQARGERVLGG